MVCVSYLNISNYIHNLTFYFKIISDNVNDRQCNGIDNVWLSVLCVILHCLCFDKYIQCKHNVGLYTMLLECIDNVEKDCKI